MHWICLCICITMCVHVHVHVRVWENTDRLMGLLRLCVLAPSGGPLPRRRRSGGLARRPRYICMFEFGTPAWWITALGSRRALPQLPVGFLCGILKTLLKTAVRVWRVKMGMRRATLKVTGLLPATPWRETSFGSTLITSLCQWDSKQLWKLCRHAIKYELIPDVCKPALQFFMTWGLHLHYKIICPAGWKKYVSENPTFKRTNIDNFRWITYFSLQLFPGTHLLTCGETAVKLINIKQP